MRHNKLRWVYMLLLGVLLSLLFRFIMFKGFNQHAYWLDLMVTCLITIFIWEGNLRLDDFLNKKYPWQSDARKRILLQLIFSFGYTALFLYSTMYSYHCYLCADNEVTNRLMRGSFIISLFVTFLMLTVEISTQFFKHWKASLVEVEKYKAENTLAQLQNLKNQINPHFLFNNLSVLSSLVYKNQDKAVDFINELSKVYRYVLDNRSNELVSIAEELSFLNHYIYLLKIRFEDNINIVLNIEADANKKYVPPMCLQMLLENAIKHNEVSMEKPLTVDIYTHDGYLVVKNKIQKRTNEEPSSKTGLKNIESRYHYFTDKKLILETINQTYIVKLPLIETV